MDFVAHPGGLLESQLPGGGGHFLVHFAEQLFLAPFEESLEAMDVVAVVLLRDPQIARGRALGDRVQQARAIPTPARVVLVDVERAGAKLKDLLQHLHRAAQPARIGKRPVELGSARLRLARDSDARKILVREDFEVRKRLVVAQVAIELRQDVLDETGFHQQGVDFAIGVDVVDVADFQHELGGARVFGRRLEEIAARPCAEALRLADVDHPAGGVFHQIDAGRLREGSHLLGSQRVVGG